MTEYGITYGPCPTCKQSRTAEAERAGAQAEVLLLKEALKKCAGIAGEDGEVIGKLMVAVAQLKDAVRGLNHYGEIYCPPGYGDKSEECDAYPDCRDCWDGWVDRIGEVINERYKKVAKVLDDG